jgi:hypothetical protein
VIKDDGIMLAAGVKVKAISESLGHANMSITLDICRHLLLGMGKTTMESFDKLLNGKRENGAVENH